MIFYNNNKNAYMHCDNETAYTYSQS